MELNDILEKLSLPQDLTRRGFLKAPRPLPRSGS